MEFSHRSESDKLDNLIPQTRVRRQKYSRWIIFELFPSIQIALFPFDGIVAIAVRVTGANLCSSLVVFLFYFAFQFDSLEHPQSADKKKYK